MHMRALPLIAAATLVILALAAMADEDPLAPLVPEEGKEGTREAYLTFTYRKTVEEQAESKGGRLNVGADKLHDRKTTQVSGRATIVVEDRDYLNLKILKVDGPEGKTRELPMPEHLQVVWSARDSTGKLGVKSYSRQTRVTGRVLSEHFSMNVWGKEDPQWSREITDSTASDMMNWSGAKAAKAGEHDGLNMSFSSQDPAESFSFSFSTMCDVTTEKRTIPPKWSDHHYRDLVPTRSTDSSTEFIDAHLPTLEAQKALPPGDEKGWSRNTQWSKTSLKVKADRSKTIKVPPDGRFLGQTTKIDETLDIQFDLEASDYEILITPPEGYKDWIPKGGASEKAVGDKLSFKGRIRKLKGTAAADREVGVNVELTSSRVPGLCMNSPRKGGKDPDLKILRAGTTDKLKIDAPVLEDETATHVAHGSFKVDDEFTVVVGCYDYGPIGGISFGGTVPVRIEGFEPKAHLKLPIDDNENSVADAWERQEGVYEKNYPADWDDVEISGQKHNGDGICLYERYRGFKNTTGAWVPLKCDQKYVFIHDPDNLLRGHGASLDFLNASQVSPLFISQDQWTGRGSQKDRKRIVNFNHEGPEGSVGGRHRVDQHALHMVLDQRRQEEGKDVPPPPGWQKAYTAAGVTSPPPQNEGGPTLGYGWPDCLPNGKYGRSPLDKYQISIYTDTITGYVATLGWGAMKGDTPEAKDEALKGYVTRHPGVFEAQVKRFLQWTLVHELGHGIGQQHHVPIYGGDDTCYMRYPTEQCYREEDDPFWLGYEHWPRAFCRGGSGPRAGNACFQHIQITDHREGR